MSSAKKKTVVSPETEPVAYIGPNIPGIATKGEVYTNGVPAALIKSAEERPLLNKLIVKLTDMPAAQKDIIQKHGAFYAAYISV